MCSRLKGFRIMGGDLGILFQPKAVLQSTCVQWMNRTDGETDKKNTSKYLSWVMAAVDEMEPLRREQLFSRTAARQISESITEGTSKARVHGRWYVLWHMLSTGPALMSALFWVSTLHNTFFLICMNVNFKAKKFFSFVCRGSLGERSCSAFLLIFLCTICAFLFIFA